MEINTKEKKRCDSSLRTLVGSNLCITESESEKSELKWHYENKSFKSQQETHCTLDWIEDNMEKITLEIFVSINFKYLTSSADY